VIEVVEDGGRRVVLIGGCNPRGVVYGAHAFFDLLRWDGSRVVFPVVSVRDWPSILWRGRPFWSFKEHLAPGVMDAYAWARVNFVDLRGTPDGKKASMGLQPGSKLDTGTLTRVVAEAHRRGLFVYGTVSCAIGAKQHEAVLTTFRQLIALGVDGLWLSFDDLGSGEDALRLVAEVLKLGREYGIEGERIAITPPMGAYKVITQRANKALVSVRGMAEARWFFTVVPSERALRAARGIGLRRKPSWWHNWPRTMGGFLHEGYAGFSLRSGGRPAYLEPQPLSSGWFHPSYEQLRGAAGWSDAVMMWGHWREEYTCGALGIWAWNPARHAWDRTRRAIYAHVFGPGQVALAMDFDDRFARLKGLFLFPERKPAPGYNWPPPLRSEADRPEALRVVQELRALLGKLERAAPKESALTRERLAVWFLEPMRASLLQAEAFARLANPSTFLRVFQGRAAALLAAGEFGRIDSELDRIAKVAEAAGAKLDALAGVNLLEAAVAGWRARLGRLRVALSNAPGRSKGLSAPPRKLRPAILERLAKGASRPPDGRLLAEVAAPGWIAGQVAWFGPWEVGTARVGPRDFVVIQYRHPRYLDVRHLLSFTTKLTTGAPLNGKVLVDLFVSNAVNYNGRPKKRLVTLLLNGRKVLSCDLGEPREGKEWLTADVTDVVAGRKSVGVRLLVDDLAPRNFSRTVVLLGPLRVRRAADQEGKERTR